MTDKKKSIPLSPSSERQVILTVRVLDGSMTEFIEWQTKFNTSISAFPGFISLEILSSAKDLESIWTMTQRFSNSGNLLKWQESKEHQSLMQELENLLGSNAIQEIRSNIANIHQGVTEVFVTAVNPNKEQAFRQWIGKIHQVEARFPGFRGMYIQAPTQEQGRNWLTFLHFDTSDNLDRWLCSAERQEVLMELKPLISSLESHRVISPYAGWFASIEQGGIIPNVWKQTMVVLLVLFPIVMLELKFLPLLIGNAHPAVATFIGNAISVTLIAWPMMPIAIRFLNWWLSPEEGNKQKTNRLGLLVVISLYLLEIAIFWNLL
jgi:antibiotic biosynthesis monooxygenase (ABM) superfamily enzyme